MASTVKKHGERRISLVKDYKQVFGTRAGERVLHDMMDTHYMLRPLIDEKSEHLTAFREGQRDVVLRILTIMKTNPEKLREHLDRHLEESEE